MPVETVRISLFCLRPGTKLGEICGDTGRYFDGLPRAGSGPCRRAGLDRGMGPVVFTEGPRPSGPAPPPPRLWAASGTETPIPQSPGVQVEGLCSVGDGAASQAVCARFCALRCKGSYNDVPALVSLPSRWGVSVALPHALYWLPSATPVTAASEEPLGPVLSLVTRLAHGCGVRRPAERPLRNAARDSAALSL